MKKNVPELSYTEAHNQAVRLYRKSAIFLLWAGIISLIANITGVLSVDSGYGMSLAFNVFINSIFQTSGLTDIAKSLLIIAVALGTGAIFAALGFFAQKGKVLYLFIGTALYLADFGAVFLVYGANWDATYAFTIATHLVILIALGVAIYGYIRFLNIEKRFEKSSSLSLEEMDERK
ncbi:MAG: hypothetical protein WC344_00685 [Bacilli bacterium]|jgi:hypothetical protein